MHIASSSFQRPIRLATPPKSEEAGGGGEEKPPELPQESGGRKAARVVLKTLVGAANGAVCSYVGQQAGWVGGVGKFWMASSGLTEGCGLGWNVGKRLALAQAGNTKANEYSRGLGALAIGFGSPFVGGAAGLAVGVACMNAGPLVSAGVFGTMALAKELAK